MSNMTKESFKHGVIKAVLVNLEKRNIKPSRVEYLKSIKDVDKAYIIANRYIRTYLKFDNKKERLKFFKVANDLGDNWEKNGNKWLDDDKSNKKKKSNRSSNTDLKPLSSEQTNKVLCELVNESNDDFIHSIEIADKSIASQNSSKNDENLIENSNASCGISILKLAIDKGVDKISKEFLENAGIEKVLVGYKNDVALYFCNSVNGIFEVI